MRDPELPRSPCPHGGRVIRDNRERIEPMKNAEQTIEEQRAITTMLLVSKGYPAPVFNKGKRYVSKQKDYNNAEIRSLIWLLSSTRSPKGPICGAVTINSAHMAYLIEMINELQPYAPETV